MRGNRDARRAGFTLIELLVVMSIIGVLAATLVFVAAPGDATLARKEARRLAALLELALAETRASGQSIAWSPVPGGYAFWRKAEDGEWVGFPEDSPYRRRSLPGATLLHDVLVDAQPLGPGERIVLTPYGLSAAIQVALTGGGASVTLRGGALRRISVQPDSHARKDDPPSAERPRIHAG
ncbi:MAG: GspH/FimT family pseudopilin [Betaproteobacteria bacterium]|nr:GspH/FimT family pseudopilin [Betaproteobacteria bacterium]